MSGTALFVYVTALEYLTSATPARISELEDLFEINRDNVKIRQMSKDVEDYERAVKEKATLEEQARLRKLEVEKLNHEAEKIKKK